MGFNYTCDWCNNTYSVNDEEWPIVVKLKSKVDKERKVILTFCCRPCYESWKRKEYNEKFWKIESIGNIFDLLKGKP